MNKNTLSERKTDKITIRVTSVEKEKLHKAADKQHMSLSEYMITAGLNKKQNSCKDKSGLCDLMTIQEICNYIEDNYEEDYQLERMCDKLWDSLS